MKRTHCERACGNGNMKEYDMEDTLESARGEQTKRKHKGHEKRE